MQSHVRIKSVKQLCRHSVCSHAICKLVKRRLRALENCLRFNWLWLLLAYANLIQINDPIPWPADNKIRIYDVTNTNDLFIKKKSIVLCTTTRSLVLAY